MTQINFKVRLQKLLDNEFSSSSNNKTQVTSGYKSLIEILKIPQLGKQLHGQHELLFQCISQIILTEFNQLFDDEQLRLLLELASNSCVLSMSQNQIIDGWLQNIEERTFEKPENYDEDEENDDDDDDDLYEDISESEEEEEEEEENQTIVRGNNKNSDRGRGNHVQQKHVAIDTSMLLKEKSPTSAPPIFNQRNPHVAHSRGGRGGHQNSERSDISETSMRGARGSVNKGSDNGRGHRASPFDNKYGVDLRRYDCYVCGEYGHVQYDCPMRRGNSNFAPRGGCNPRGSRGGGGGFNNKNDHRRRKSSSSSSSIPTNNESILTENHQNKIHQIYNSASKLLNSSLTTDDRTKTFELIVSNISQLSKQHSEANLQKVFLEKESIFYSLYCHIAQNDFLFSNDQYLKFYHLKNLLLSNQKQSLLNEDRSKFCRQRTLIPLNFITEHIQTVTQIQQTYFNDFQEYIIRSNSPISIILFDLLKYLIKSNIHIDLQCLEYFIENILFNSKKNIFSNEQLEELRFDFDIRQKRSQRNYQKQIWKERLNSFKNERIIIQLNQWIKEFEEILKTNDDKPKELTTIVVDNVIWYFGVLRMSSSGHLNKEQYDDLLKLAIQSTLFNSIQKFYLEFYLNQGQAPIMIKELNEIKNKLESGQLEDKKLGYELIKNILDRQRPEFCNEKSEQSSPEINDLTQVNNQSNKPEDIIAIIDNHILLRVISLIETICCDKTTFSTEQCKELLDKILHQSKIIRPLSNADQERLQSYYSRPLSINEINQICSSTESDLTDFLSLLSQQTITNNDEILDLITSKLINIFKNREKFSNEKCEELKNLSTKKLFGKQRYSLLNTNYQNYRLNPKTLHPIKPSTSPKTLHPIKPSINPIILNQLLNNILLQDYQAHLEFFTLLEELSQEMNFEQITIDFEILRCLLSTIILVIAEADFSNSSNIDFFRQRLKSIIEKQTKFVSLLLTEKQCQLVISRLTSTSDIDPIINSLKMNFNEKNFQNLIVFIQNQLKEKIDLEKIIQFILYTFDNQLLTIEQTLQISNLIYEHSKFNIQVSKNLLRFLMDLLQLNIQSSPKIFLHQIEHNQGNDQTINQIIMMLKAENGKYAVADWKRTMLQLLTILFNRQENYEQLKEIAQQSPMLQMATFKQQLESYWKKTLDETTQSSATSKSHATTDHSAAHREMFLDLESDDASRNSLVIQQLHTILLDEHLPSEILLPKFIQALQIIFRNSKKFTEISFDEWATSISKNRGKIFSDDIQCDQLLINILFARLNMSIDTLNSLHRLIQSRRSHERHDGLHKLLSLLKNTHINNEKEKINNLPTISNQLYEAVTRVIFDQKFNDNQVRQCLTAAKNSWLISIDDRQKLNNI